MLIQFSSTTFNCLLANINIKDVSYFLKIVFSVTAEGRRLSQSGLVWRVFISNQGFPNIFRVLESVVDTYTNDKGRAAQRSTAHLF